MLYIYVLSTKNCLYIPSDPNFPKTIGILPLAIHFLLVLNGLSGVWPEVLCLFGEFWATLLNCRDPKTILEKHCFLHIFFLCISEPKWIGQFGEKNMIEEGSGRVFGTPQ